MNDNIKYYKYLDSLKETRFKNNMDFMFGAYPMLANEFDLEEKEAKNILLFWMEHYDNITAELKK